jgi:hypothetical protein
MRVARLLLVPVVAVAVVIALNACPSKVCNVQGGPPCAGGCCGGCTCNANGDMLCPGGGLYCPPTCLDDAGTHMTGEVWLRGDQSCTCDYNGNVSCCPASDAGGCVMACVDEGDGGLHQVGEAWAGADGGTCVCRLGYTVDCSLPPDTAHCSFEGQGYVQGQSVDAGPACECACGSDGHLSCPSQACLPTHCTVDGSGYQVGLVFPTLCNFCVCGDDGAAACTSRVCSGGQCEYAGTVYDAGAMFPSADNCNTCTCQAGGDVQCTTNACAAVHCVVDAGAVAVGTTFFTADKCDLCGCGSDGVVYCTHRACSP